MENEIWKECPSKPGLLASNYGRIWLTPRPYLTPKGGVITPKTKPTFGIKTKASKRAMHQFFGYWFRRFGNVKVHRVVCEAWHGPPPQQNSIVLHLDENALNNKPENLKWGTQKENLNMPKFINYCKSRTGQNSPTTKHKNKLKVA